MSITLTNQKKDQLEHLKVLAKIAAESKQYSNQSEVSLLNLMLSADDLGISPMKAINGGFYIVNGKVCMSTSLMADRIRRAGHSIKIVAMTKEKCVIVATRKDNGDSINLEYTIEEAAMAGLTQSTTWKKYPKIMLYNRCMSCIARILFSDVIGNSYSEEERFDIQNIPPEKRPLEPQEDDITVESNIPKFELTFEQREHLTCIFDQLSDEDQNKLCDTLGVISIIEIDSKDFDRVVRTIEKRISSKSLENTTSA